MEVKLPSRWVLDRIDKGLSLNSDGDVFWKAPSSYNILPGTIAGTKTKSGYLRIAFTHKENGRERYYAHQIAYYLANGVWPTEIVDHKNGATTDNLPSNLRLADDSQSGCNTKAHRDNQLGEKGVSYDKARNKFLARLSVRRTNVLMKRFDTFEEAKAARVAAELEHHRDFASVLGVRKNPKQ